MGGVSDLEAWARQWRRLALMLLKENAELRQELVAMAVRLETARMVNPPELRSITGGKP